METEADLLLAVYSPLPNLQILLCMINIANDSVVGLLVNDGGCEDAEVTRGSNLDFLHIFYQPSTDLFGNRKKGETYVKLEIL